MARDNAMTGDMDGVNYVSLEVAGSHVLSSSALVVNLPFDANRTYYPSPPMSISFFQRDDEDYSGDDEW